MIPITLALVVAATLGRTNGRILAGDNTSVSSLLLNETCQEIAATISAASAVYDIASVNYVADINHWASSSTQLAACSFEPGTPEDIGEALQILGQTRTPFAVKGGGHATNPGFSSTKGVQIAMSRFSDVIYDSEAQTATIGAGLIWDDVYAKLEPYGVNVAGARVSGVGVAGSTLGGGYSWFTSQYGLTTDTVQVFELVMPNGTVANITKTSSPDLFFALKGGFNNFGIVTKFTLKVFPQTQVWGGVIVYPDILGNPDVLDKVNQATANFGANNKDPKAAIITSYNYFLGRPIPTVIIFYDAPEAPSGVFDEFLAISPSIQNLATSSFRSFVQSIPQYAPARAVYNSISVTGYSLSLLQQITEQAAYWAEKLTGTAVFIDYDVQPFLTNYLEHNTTPSAYPPDRSRGLSPLNIYFTWLSPESDQDVYDAVQTSAKILQADAIDGGLSDTNAFVYPNFAIFSTPLDKMYGANLPRLQAIKEVVDPENVMSLAGGFKF